MSDTLGNLRANVRTRTGDVSPQDPAFSDERINRSLELFSQFVSNEVYQGVAWVDPAITLVSGTTDYALSAAEYGQIILLRLASQGWLLARTTTEDMERFRLGASAAQTKGDPDRYTLIESTGQTITVRLWPQPNKADTIAILRSVLVGALASDSATIPFSQPLCRAVELMACSELVGSASDSQLAKLLVSRDSAPMWKQLADRAVVKEKERIQSLKVPDGVVRKNSGGWL